MKLTKDDKKHFMSGDIEWFGSSQGRENFWQQIQDDYEKARKFDEIKDGTLGFIRAFNWLDKNKSIFLSTPSTPEPETPQPRKNQNQKLRELVEKKIEDFASRKLPHVVIHELQKLLEESKR